MNKKDLPLILAGVGILYLITRSSTTYAGGGTVPYSGGVSPIPGVGSIVTSISNLIGNLFHPGIVSNPGTDVINNPGAYPNVPPNYGTTVTDSGNPCDPSSVQYNQTVCDEMSMGG